MGGPPRPLVHMGRLVDRVNKEILQIAGSNVISGDFEYIAIFDDWISETDVALAKDGKRALRSMGSLSIAMNLAVTTADSFTALIKPNSMNFTWFLAPTADMLIRQLI
jgi:hypothetical protein